ARTMYEYGRGDLTQPGGCNVSREAPAGTAIADIAMSAPLARSVTTVVRAGGASVKYVRYTVFIASKSDARFRYTCTEQTCPSDEPACSRTPRSRSRTRRVCVSMSEPESLPSSTDPSRPETNTNPLALTAVLNG